MNRTTFLKLVSARDLVFVFGVLVAAAIAWLKNDSSGMEIAAIVALFASSLLFADALLSHGRRRLESRFPLPSDSFADSIPFVQTVRRVINVASILAGTFAAITLWQSLGGVGIDWAVGIGAAAIAIGGRVTAEAVSLCYARGLSESRARGIAYGDARTFDLAGRIDVTVFCSRGTVLQGEPEVVAIEPLGAVDLAQLVGLVTSAEIGATHPYALALLRAAKTSSMFGTGVRAEGLRNVELRSGLGVTAISEGGERLVVGRRALLIEECVSVAHADSSVAEQEAQGRSVLLVALGGKLIGLISLRDSIRKGVAEAVDCLHSAQIEPVLLSGDSRDVCDAMGKSLGIDHIRPEVLPVDRASEVRALGAGGHMVAVVGSRSRDDGVLAAAHVAVILGDDQARQSMSAQSGTVTVGSDDIRDGVTAITLARNTRAQARTVFGNGIAPGVVASLGIAFGFLPPAVAAISIVLGALLSVVTMSRSPRLL